MFDFPTHSADDHDFGMGCLAGYDGLGAGGQKFSQVADQISDALHKVAHKDDPWYKFSEPIPVEKMLLIGGGLYFLYKVLELHKRR